MTNISNKKESYISVNTECDENNELCVICLDNMDSRNVATQPHTVFLNCECECKYYVHGSCFEMWVDKRPTEISCLICLSKAEQLYNYNRYMREYILIYNCRYLRRTCVNLISCVLCLFRIMLMLGIIVRKHVNYDS